MKREFLYRLIAGAALLVGGAVVGTSIPTANQARGEVRATPEPQAFQSGGQLSVPVLKDISATLHQIDGRLARLEAVFQKLTAVQAGRSRSVQSPESAVQQP
jgi:hypothetical protein